MKLRFLSGLIATLLFAVAYGAENFDDALKKAAVDYAERLKQANDELIRTRERIAKEKAPLLDELRATEARISALEREINRLSTDQEQAAAKKRQLIRDIEDTRKTSAYITTLATDALKAANEGLLPGESALIDERLRTLQEKLDSTAATATSGPAALDVAEFLLARTERALGGNLVTGRALDAGTNLAKDGTFAFAGPEVFFQPSGGGAAGIVRLREGSRQPVFYPQAAWTSAESAALFSGKMGTLPVDSSGGKALRLQQTGASPWEYIGRGGKVAYAIVLVGIVALLLIVAKIWDVVSMRIDTSSRVPAFLRSVAGGSRAEAQSALNGIAPTTREIFAEGMRYIDAPQEELEERLEAVLLGQRLHFERRLPLLAVIATASPLMGLLGTVVGMVKTFTLITVFGTGNASKLSSGISEVLVATELGLAVAIPTLVVHGFLAHRINKNLAVLERQALEFATAVSAARSSAMPEAEMAK